MPNFQGNVNQILSGISSLESQFMGNDDEKSNAAETIGTDTKQKTNKNTGDGARLSGASMTTPDRYKAHRIMQETANRIREKINQKAMHEAFMKYIRPETNGENGGERWKTWAQN